MGLLTMLQRQRQVVFFKKRGGKGFWTDMERNYINYMKARRNGNDA